MMISDLRLDPPAPKPVPDAPPPMLPESASPTASREDPLARIRPLLRRFCLPDLCGEDEERARAEAAACAALGMADALYLACLLGCLARCSNAGPLVADGPWCGSSVLAACGVVCVAAEASDGEPYDRMPDLAALADAGALGPPRLLIGAAAEDLLDAAQRELLPLEAPGLQVEARMPSALHLSLLAASGETGALPAPVELAQSALLSLVRRLQQYVEQHTGVWIDEQCVPPSGEDLGRELDALWQRHLPDLPRWVRSRADGAGSAAEAWRAWCAAAPMPLPATTRAALRTRAHLAWCFTYLATMHPAGAWSVLLSRAAPAAAHTLFLAARAAGCALAPPTIQEPHLDWEPVGERSLRCGLSCADVTPELVRALRASLAQDGPFRSAFDLAERVPQVAALLLLLAASGALDVLHPRAVMLGSWGDLAHWAGQYEAARACAAPAPVSPELVGREESASRQRLWAAVFAPCSPAALAEDADDVAGGDVAAGAATATSGDALADEDAIAGNGAAAAGEGSLLPATGVRSAGDRRRIGGFVRARRAIQEDGDELVVLGLDDGHAVVQVLVTWDAPAARLEPGCWATCLAVRTADPRVLLDPLVAAPPAARPVRVTVQRSGDREADLACIVRVHEVLDAHHGYHPVAIALQQGDRRRLLDLGTPACVAWTSAVVEGLEAVVGRQHVALDDGGA